MGSGDGTQLGGKQAMSLALIFILDDDFLNRIDFMLINGELLLLCVFCFLNTTQGVKKGQRQGAGNT